MIVGVPAAVSRYLNCALVALAGIVTLVIVAVSAALRKLPPDESVDKATTVAVLTAEGIETVMVAEDAPAVNVCEPGLSVSFGCGGAQASET